MRESIKNNWTKAIAERSFRSELATTFLCLSILLFSLSYFFTFIEARPSHKVNDVILNLLKPIDVSLYTFSVIYSLAIYTIIIGIKQPGLFLKAVQAYTLMLLFRMITIYVVPLEAPEGIIPLQDPFIENFFYGQTRITKDLFFSGHVATVTLLFLVNQNPKLKWLYITAIILVSVLIMMQHVHYSFDVFVAPIFAWGCWKIISVTLGTSVTKT